VLGTTVCSVRVKRSVSNVRLGDRMSERIDDHNYCGRWHCRECATLTKQTFRCCTVETFIVPSDCIHKTGVKPVWRSKDANEGIVSRY
jgi:hypothetical protein